MKALSRVCPQCGEAKPVEDFYVNRKSKDGYQHKCKSCCNKYSREHYKHRGRTQVLSKQYGLVPGELDFMLLSQGGKCSICHEPFTFTPHVDHNHNSGRVRALLCIHCNVGLGHFKDNPNLLRSAATYLDTHNDWEGTEAR